MRQSDSIQRLQQQQWRVVACGLQTGVWLIAAVVLSRRVSGDAGALATQWAACLIGCGAMAVSVLTTSFLHGDNPQSSGAEHGLLPEALSLLPGLMLGLALLPEGGGGGLAALLGLFAVGFGAQVGLVTASRRGRSWQRSFARRQTEDSSRLEAVTASAGAAAPAVPVAASPSMSADLAPPAPSAATAADASSQEPSAARTVLECDLLQATDFDAHDTDFAETQAPLLTDEQSDAPFGGPDTRQWMSRSLLDGYDVVEGELQVDFAAGQRLVAVHLPFSPPLAGTPDFECECLDELDVSFRTTARHSYGVRVEVSRSGSLTESATARIGWAASAVAADASANNDTNTASESAPSASAA